MVHADLVQKVLKVELHLLHQQLLQDVYKRQGWDLAWATLLFFNFLIANDLINVF